MLVAGDIYDVATAEDRTLGQPLERMRAFPDVAWHLIPGNHDPHQPGGPWERVLRRGLPDNVRVHLEPAPVELADGEAQLLPAPLLRRRALADPTAWMDQAPSPAGVLRIGLAHGSITAFGSDAQHQPNLIDPARPERAGLGYLALGDWHGMKRIGPRCWYSGTPEVDDFGVEGGGQALLVELRAPGAPPEVTPLGGRPLRLAPGDAADPWRRTTSIVLAARLRALHAEPARLLLDLTLEGTLSLDRPRAAGARPRGPPGRRLLAAGRRAPPLSRALGRGPGGDRAGRLPAGRRGAPARHGRRSGRAGARDRRPGAAPPLCRASEARGAMKLCALELEQFRKFDRPIRVAGLADGLNLVVGPNEMGKSTLFAALQAVLFERHRSQAQTVRSFQPAGHEGAAPRVALDFEIDGRRYRIEKRFLRRPSAELTLPDGRRLHGEPAEEALEALLGGAAADDAGGRRGGGRGGRRQEPALGRPGPVLRPARDRAGARAARSRPRSTPSSARSWRGDHGAALIATLSRRCSELVYKAGRPRGRYKEADDARQALELEVADLEARRDELERDLERARRGARRL